MICLFNCQPPYLYSTVYRLYNVHTILKGSLGVSQAPQQKIDAVRVSFGVDVKLLS